MTGKKLTLPGLQQDRQRRYVFGTYVAIHQKTFSIFGHVIGKNVGTGNRRAAANLEQGRGCSRDERVRAIDRDGYQHSVWSDIEDLSTVSAPARLGATTS